MWFEIYRQQAGLISSPDGVWRWRLKSANGDIIADSGEAYVNRQGALAGIALVKSTDSNTRVIDL